MENISFEAHNGTEAMLGLGPYSFISRNVFIIVGITLVVIGVTASLVLITIFCLDQTLRRSSKHFLILVITSLCLLEQCLGAFIVHSHLYNVDILMEYGCEVSYLMSAASYISVSVVVLLVSAVAFDTVLTLSMNSTTPPGVPSLSTNSTTTSPQGVRPLSMNSTTTPTGVHSLSMTSSTTPPGVRICIAVEWVVVVVAGSALILLPLMNVSEYTLTCSVYMEHRDMLILNVLHFLPQVLVLVLANLVMLMSYNNKHGRTEDGEVAVYFPTDIFLASIVVVAFKMPDFIFSFGLNECIPGEDSCRSMFIFWAVATYLSTGVYVILPLTWFVGKDTRDGAKRILAYYKCCGATYRQDMYSLTGPEPV